MNIAQIEKNLHKLMKSLSRETFIFDLLSGYGLPKASITRLKKGNLNLSKKVGELSWKKKVFFKEVFDEDLHTAVSDLAAAAKHDQRFVIVTDYQLLLAIDTKTHDRLDIELVDLPKHYDFFLPWAGMEKARHANENPADVKAAERMAKLFDEIRRDNPDESPEFVHGLNVFLSRLLFCFFAEDTGIFGDSQFTDALSSHTQADGGDLHDFLDMLFRVLNTPDDKRKNGPVYLNAFPYVNGGLFKHKLLAPIFTRRSRQAVIDSGELDWSAINPDIFGSMIQAVVSPEHRGGLGMHYTSVPNIMKVIEPLFLNDLYEAFELASGKQRKLEDLLALLSRVKIFDPACGSGNFLIIAYKELRRLEIEILRSMKDRGILPMSNIKLTQFYGIELDDFAHEVAQLSLWLAEHQMNTEFLNEFGRTNPTLPLKEAGNIVLGNACRMNWHNVCPVNNKNEIIHIIGNPPYLGGKSQKKEQKEDISIASGIKTKIGELDYISAWFFKASEYIRRNIDCAFVTTSSVSQGSQVQQLWPHILKKNVEISFAYSPFKWNNNARDKAGVVVTIISLGAVDQSRQKLIFSNGHIKKVANINPYLIDGPNVIVEQRLKPLSRLPRMITGNSPYDGKNLVLSDEEYRLLSYDYPEAKPFIRPLRGTDDYLYDRNRWCLWIPDEMVHIARSIAPIAERISNCKISRENGGEVARGLTNCPHKFRYTHEAKQHLIIVPRHSSERRRYIPFGLLDKSIIVGDSAQVIYDPEPYIFSIVLSYMHQVWTRMVAGTIGSSIRYASALCYNTFPFPQSSGQRILELTGSAFRIVEERERCSEKSPAQLYDPDKMPDGLREAHRLNDLAVDRCYRSKPFENDEERLEFLFKLYEQMIEDEQNKGSLFEPQKKKRRRR